MLALWQSCSTFRAKEDAIERGLEAFMEEMEREISALELERARIEGRLEEKRQMMDRLQAGRTIRVEPDFPSRGRRSITALGRHFYEFEGQQIRTPGELLDRFDAPHYFSRLHGGMGDSAARQIMRWALAHPDDAGSVTVVMSDGTRLSLYDAVVQITKL